MGPVSKCMHDFPFFGGSSGNNRPYMLLVAADSIKQLSIGSFDYLTEGARSIKERAPRRLPLIADPGLFYFVNFCMSDKLQFVG